jgi:hypothetical protein
MRKIFRLAQCALLMVGLLIFGVVGVSADEVIAVDPIATEAQQVIVVAQGNSEWESLRELVIIVMSGLVGLGTLYVLFRSSPADFSERALENVSKLIKDIAEYQKQAELTPTKLDDLAGYLAMFSAEQLREALRRQTDQPPEAPLVG